MTEMQRRTAGLAIGSLICGCFSLIPIIGLLPSLPAIILGIIALTKISKNKETMKGNGLAIAGIVMGSLSLILLPIVGLIAAIAIPNFLRAKISANEALAKSTIKVLSTAADTYRVSNNQYPTSIYDLTTSNPPYVTTNYCDQTISGYSYSCTFGKEGYVFTASPEQEGTTGTKIFTIDPQGDIIAEDVYGEYKRCDLRRPQPLE